MRTIRNVNDALLEAIVMLRVIERGGSYNTADWYERVNKIQSFLNQNGGGMNEPDLHNFVMFDLQAAKTRTKGHIR